VCDTALLDSSTSDSRNPLAGDQRAKLSRAGLAAACGGRPIDGGLNFSRELPFFLRRLSYKKGLSPKSDSVREARIGGTKGGAVGY
jgi:hypothetical protein